MGHRCGGGHGPSFTPLGLNSAEADRGDSDLLDWAVYYDSNGMHDLADFCYSAYLAGYDADDLSVFAPGGDRDRGDGASDQWDLLDSHVFITSTD